MTADVVYSSFNVFGEVLKITCVVTKAFDIDKNGNSICKFTMVYSIDLYLLCKNSPFLPHLLTFSFINDK